jgi:osmotically-inducible protein OsmY
MSNITNHINYPKQRDLTQGAHYGKGPKGWPSDEKIKKDVSIGLFLNPEVPSREIAVKVDQGVVTLEGFVRDREEKKAAEECIENLPGVFDVLNKLILQEGHKNV